MKKVPHPSPKIAVLHDSFLYRGGGERLVTLMARALGADLISGFFSDGSFDPRELGFDGKIIALGKPVFKKGIRHLSLKHRFLTRAKILRDYDIVILSGNCLDALRHVRADARVFYYCHTPPRYLFDFRERYMASFPRIFRPMITRFFDRQAKTYVKQLDRIDTIFTNSQNTHDRLLHFCTKESTILYPPTDTTQFVPGAMEDFGQKIPLTEEQNMVWQAEKELLNPAVRASAEKISACLADDFIEIGRSGRRFNKNDILERLPAGQGESDFTATNPSFVQLSDSLILVSYTLRDTGGASYRSSVWDVSDSAPKMRFHQGTILPAANSELPHEYYLSFSRLSPPKRVDMVVDAFLKMPDKNLVFTYGKNDPQKDEIIEKCKNAKNIFPIPAPSNAEFIRLVQGAIANIYIPVDEDFGMSPVESMACGVPVIGVDEGGLRETVIEGKTGFLLPAKITVKDVMDGVQKMTPNLAHSMREACVRRAEDFSLDTFIKNLKKYIF